MYKLWRRWLMAVAVVVLTGSVGRAQPAAARKDIAESQAWWSEMFGFGSEKDKTLKPLPEPGKKGKDKGAASAEPVQPTLADKEAQHQRIKQAFLRRQDVIDRLREIAAETDNASLNEEANRLDEMAMRIYQRDSGKILGRAATVPAPDALDQGTAARDSGRAMRTASPGGSTPTRGQGATADSLERSAGLRGGDR